jgi:hypothetical protein
VVVAVLGLAASGASAATSAGLSPLRGASAVASAHDAAPVTACRVLTAITSLVVRRGTPPNPSRFSFPATVRVGEASAARSVARALCALPVMPKGVFCPADLGPRYTLSFTAPARRVAQVVVDPTGCETVQGLAGTRWVARSPGFWRVLGDAMHLRGATQQTFAGRLTSS